MPALPRSGRPPEAGILREFRMDHPMALELTSEDRAALAGDRGEAVRLAMRIVVALAGATGAARLIDVTSAHVDGCLYHGEVSLDFARRLEDAGARVRIPTTLNVGTVD